MARRRVPDLSSGESDSGSDVDDETDLTSDDDDCDGRQAHENSPRIPRSTRRSDASSLGTNY